MKTMKGALLALLVVGAMGATPAFAEVTGGEKMCPNDSHWMTPCAQEGPLSPGMDATPREEDPNAGNSSDPLEKN